MNLQCGKKRERKGEKMREKGWGERETKRRKIYEKINKKYNIVSEIFKLERILSSPSFFFC